jgi:hypothetical protein
MIAIELVLTCCINSTRGREGHEPPRWIRALVKETGCGRCLLFVVLTFFISSTRGRGDEVCMFCGLIRLRVGFVFGNRVATTRIVGGFYF